MDDGFELHEIFADLMRGPFFEVVKSFVVAVLVPDLVFSEVCCDIADNLVRVHLDNRHHGVRGYHIQQSHVSLLNCIQFVL